MSKGKLIVILLALLVAATCCLALFGCNGTSPDCVLEAEQAVCEPSFDTSQAVITRANTHSEHMTSNGKYVGSMYKGATITWFFTAERQTSCELTLAVANATDSAEGFDVGDGTAFGITFNDAFVALSNTFVGEGTQYGDCWETLSLGTFRVRPGVNKVVYTALSDEKRLNVDYLRVISSTVEIKEHNHFWKSETTAASCLEQGYITKTCEDCGYTYIGDIIPPLEHRYGNYHYDDKLNKMVSVCERCGDEVTADKPDSMYFGQVYYDETNYNVRANEILCEAEDAYVCIDGGLNNGTSYIKKDDGDANNPSGGKLVENISRVGNYIRFCAEASKPCTVDLVFRMSNTLYGTSGIAELNPMSEYVYGKVNGIDVDFSFVSFPGIDNYSYFEWRYVVVKNVQFNSGKNYVEIGPKDNERHWITMPNTDVLKIYSDDKTLAPVKYYQINDVVCGEYDGRYTQKTFFTATDDRTYDFYCGNGEITADYVIKLYTDADTAVLANVFSLSVNGGEVNLEGVSLKRGYNTLVLKDQPLLLLKNIVVSSQNKSIKVEGVTVYTAQKVIGALDCGIDSSRDYLNNADKPDVVKPTLVFEAEDADLGDSVSSREGIDLVEKNIYENSGKHASGNSAVGNFAVAGNLITWRFDCSRQTVADITLMLASANFSSSEGGNTATKDLQTRIVIRINGVAVRLDEVELTVDSRADYHDWKAVTIGGCLIREGSNEVTIEVLDYGAPNMDVMYVYADEGVLLTPQQLGKETE